MKTCMSCGAMVPDTAKFCRACGAPLQDIEQEKAEYMPDPEDKTVIIPDAEEATEIQEPEKPADFHRVAGEPAEPWGYEQPPEPEHYYQEPRGYEREQVRQSAPPRQEYHYPPAYQQQGQQGQRQAYQRPPQNQTPAWDHTAEFDPKDISDNKVVAMLIYLLGGIGIIIALLASSTSPYAAFHVRQGLKFVVLNCLIGLAAAAIFLIMLPISMATMYGSIQNAVAYNSFNAGGMIVGGGFTVLLYGLLGIFWVALFIVRIICFFSICKGNAKEPPIVRAFGFMR